VNYSRELADKKVEGFIFCNSLISVLRVYGVGSESCQILIFAVGDIKKWSSAFLMLDIIFLLQTRV
jgi:hypothetical protein